MLYFYSHKKLNNNTSHRGIQFKIFFSFFQNKLFLPLESRLYISQFLITLIIKLNPKLSINYPQTSIYNIYIYYIEVCSGGLGQKNSPGKS